MAATTLKAIIDRFQVVCEHATVDLNKSNEEFSFDLQPNLRVDNVYRIQDDGLTQVDNLTNSVEARIDGLSIWIARKATPESQAVRESMLQKIDTIVRRVLADGPANSYHANMVAREVQRTGDIITARIGFTVDYDFSAATS